MRTRFRERSQPPLFILGRHRRQRAAGARTPDQENSHSRSRAGPEVITRKLVVSDDRRGPRSLDPQEIDATLCLRLSDGKVVARAQAAAEFDDDEDRIRTVRGGQRWH